MPPVSLRRTTRRALSRLQLLALLALAVAALGAGTGRVESRAVDLAVASLFGAFTLGCLREVHGFWRRATPLGLALALRSAGLASAAAATALAHALPPRAETPAAGLTLLAMLLFGVSLWLSGSARLRARRP